MKRLMRQVAVAGVFLICLHTLLQAQPSGSYYGRQNFVDVWGGYGYSVQKDAQVHSYVRESLQKFPAAFLSVMSIGMAFETAEVVNRYHRQWPSTRWEKDAGSWLFQCTYIYTQGKIEQPSGILRAFRPFVGDTVTAAAVLSADVSLSVVQVGVLHKYRLIQKHLGDGSSYSSWLVPCYVAIGGTMGWSVSGKMQQSGRLHSSDGTAILLPIEGGRIEEQGQSVKLEEEDIPRSNRFRLGLKAGLLYEIKALPSSRSPVNALTIIPSLWVEYPVVNVQGDYSFKALSAHLGLSFSFAIDNPVVYDEDEGRYITPAEFPGNYPYDYPPYKKD